MVSRKDSNAARLARHKRVRAKISGTPDIPRLCVYRSLANIRAQIIDDVNGVNLVSVNLQNPIMTENMPRAAKLLPRFFLIRLYPATQTKTIPTKTVIPPCHESSHTQA